MSLLPCHRPGGQLVLWCRGWQGSSETLWKNFRVVLKRRWIGVSVGFSDKCFRKPNLCGCEREKVNWHISNTNASISHNTSNIWQKCEQWQSVQCSYWTSVLANWFCLDPFQGPILAVAICARTTVLWHICCYSSQPSYLPPINKGPANVFQSLTTSPRTRTT